MLNDIIQKYSLQPWAASSQSTMKIRLFRHFMACVALALTIPAVSLAETAYKFGVVPQFEPRKLSEVWSPILTELEKRTGFKFLMEGSPRIPEFEAEFQAGRYDFAYMNPYHSIVAHGTQKYEPIVRDGAEQLFGILVARKEGTVHGVSDLNGKTVAFPAPNAFGASLMIRAELDRHKVKFQPLWAQTHTSAFLNVALGKADAAGGLMTTFRQQPQAVQDKLQIIFETRRTAPHPVVAHPRVPKADSLAVRKAFIDMAATPEGAAMLAQVPMRQVVAASFDDYKVIRQMGLEKYYVKGGD